MSRHLCMMVGETKSIYLSGNPSTGYQWIHSDSPILSIRSRYIPSDGGIGSGGTYEFAITALDIGEATIYFRDLRMW